MQSRRRSSGLTSLQDYDYNSTQGIGDQFGSRQMESTGGGGRTSMGVYKERLESPNVGTGGGVVAPKSKGKDLFFQNKSSPSPSKQNRNALMDQQGTKAFTSSPSKLSQSMYSDQNNSTSMNTSMNMSIAAQGGSNVFSPSPSGRSSIRGGLGDGNGRTTTPGFVNGIRGTVLTPVPSTGKKNRRQLVSLMDDDVDGPGSSDVFLGRNMGGTSDTNNNASSFASPEGFAGGNWGLRNRHSGMGSHQAAYGDGSAMVASEQALVDGDTQIHQNRTWVLIFGFSATNSDESILRRFQQIGHIRDYIPSEKTRGNWMLIKYETPWEARRAVSELNCTDVAVDSLSSMVIGVTEVDAHIAAKYNFQLQLDGTITLNSIVTNQPRGITPRRPSQAAQSHSTYRHHRQVETKDIYRPPRRRASICSRILQYFALD